MHFEGLELNFERLERYLELLQRHFGRSEAVLTRQMSSLEGVFRVWEGLPNLVTPATFVGRRSGAAPRPPHLRPLLPSANPSHLLLGSRLPVEGREEDGQEPGRLGMPPGRDGPVPGVEVFPLPEHGDRPGLADDRRELPRAGQVGRLARFVLSLQVRDSRCRELGSPRQPGWNLYELSELEPRLLWAHFDRLRLVPRPSRHEQQVRALVESWAQERGFALRRDSYGNSVVSIPATPGCEEAPRVILQGHLDMVCERSPEVDFDFLLDPIRARVEGEWVCALGTTLGADNGIGVAAALSVADDPEAMHGPLEILLTVEEELGLRGALQLDGSLLEGKILLNLDSEDPAFYVGCAGATDTVGHFRVHSTAAPGGRVGEVVVSGLSGGHSGLSILGNPANAIKLLASVLGALRSSGVEFGLLGLRGGNSRNAIPREARAALWVTEGLWTAVAEVVRRQEALFVEEFAGVEADLRIEWRELSRQNAHNIWERADRERILDTLLACPHGVLAMSRTIAGLVETSNNLAMLESSGDEVTVSTLARSSSALSLDAISCQVAAVFRLAGAAAEVHHGYPGWQPNLESSLLLRAIEVHERLFGRRPPVKAIHAGLECGVIGQKVKGVDAISFGPTIEGAHTPAERVHVGSVVAFYRLLTGLLEELARPIASRQTRASLPVPSLDLP